MENSPFNDLSAYLPRNNNTSEDKSCLGLSWEEVINKKVESDVQDLQDREDKRFMDIVNNNLKNEILKVVKRLPKDLLFRRDPDRFVSENYLKMHEVMHDPKVCPDCGGARLLHETCCMCEIRNKNSIIHTDISKEELIYLLSEQVLNADKGKGLFISKKLIEILTTKSHIYNCTSCDGPSLAPGECWDCKEKKGKPPDTFFRYAIQKAEQQLAEKTKNSHIPKEHYMSENKRINKNIEESLVKEMSIVHKNALSPPNTEVQPICLEQSGVQQAKSYNGRGTLNKKQPPADKWFLGSNIDPNDTP